jgi:hypothetical protein
MAAFHGRMMGVIKTSNRGWDICGVTNQISFFLALGFGDEACPMEVVFRGLEERLCMADLLPPI